VAIDFLCISPKAGDVINAAAAKQLINIKRLVFNVTPPFLFKYTSHKALAPIGFRDFGALNSAPARPPMRAEDGSLSHDGAH